MYVRYNALINGTGGGGSQNGGAGNATIDPATTALISYNTGTQSTTPQRDYQVPVYGTLVANRPFTAETSGFASEPGDGLTQPDASDIATGTLTDQPSIVRERYVSHTPPAAAVTVTGYAQATVTAGRDANIPADVP